MFIKATLLLTLFTAASLALPSSRERLQARVDRRLSRPKKSAVSHPEFSSNWAGAVLNDVEVCVISHFPFDNISCFILGNVQ